VEIGYDTKKMPQISSFRKPHTRHTQDGTARATTTVWNENGKHPACAEKKTFLQTLWCTPAKRRLLEENKNLFASLVWLGGDIKCFPERRKKRIKKSFLLPVAD
jgi:hypothetical protein